MKTDAQLVESAKNNDMDAFGELFERYRGYVYSVAKKRTDNHDDAMDMVQNTFIRAMEKISTLKDHSSIKTWLGIIAKRLSLNYSMRQAKRSPSHFDDAGVFAENISDDDTLDAPSTLIKIEFTQAMREALGQLKLTDRETLTMFYFEGKSISEISQSKNTPEGTIKRRLFTARNRLGYYLKTAELV